MIDLKNLFTELQIAHWTSGKNVSTGWVGVRCIYCNDRSNHLGINIETGKYKCWKCPAEGWLDNLLVDMIQVTFREARAIVARHRISDSPHIAIEKAPKPVKQLLKMPYSSTLPKMHRDYLASRGFAPLATQKKYGLLATGPTGEWGFRIIIPIYMNGKMVNFTSRAIAGQEPKYKHCPDPEAVIDMKSCLYNIDSVQEQMVIMEGVTDVWKWGAGAVATFGTKVTDAQVMLITKKRPKDIFIMFDADAKREMEKLAARLATVARSCNVVYLPFNGKDDPGSFNHSDVLELKRKLNDKRMQ